MSEKIFYTPKSLEQEPSIEIKRSEGSEVILRRTNSGLYTYLGNIAMFNHVYYLGGDNDVPFYIFQEFTPKSQFDSLASHMIRFEFPHFANQGWVDETDIAAFEAHVKKRDTDSIENVVQSWAATEE